MKIKKSTLFGISIAIILVVLMVAIPTGNRKTIDVNKITLKNFQKLPVITRMKLLENGAPRNVAHVRQKEIVRAGIENYIRRWSMGVAADELASRVHLVSEKEFKQAGEAVNAGESYR